MPLTFQSICSGSGGNCLLLRNGSASLLIDVGFSTQRACRAALEPLLPAVDAVVVSHLHGDHIHYSALRVLEAWDTPLFVHAGDVAALRARHGRGRRFDGLAVEAFGDETFQVGEFAIQPFQVPHYPACPTFGFEVRCGANGRERKVVVASDLADGLSLERRFADADFIYVEANHDPQLLALHWNPNSRYHLSNGACGRLLRGAFEASRALPPAVMLGHLSDERNEPTLATHTVWEILDDAGFAGVEVHVAPAREPSEPIAIA
ncbi:MAG: MBL fold metallo-hydrolase [Planctomycetota bacterium]